MEEQKRTAAAALSLLNVAGSGIGTNGEQLLSSWFAENGLSAYLGTFEAAGFDSVHDLYDLDREDLEKLGVRCVPRPLVLALFHPGL